MKGFAIALCAVAMTATGCATPSGLSASTPAMSATDTTPATREQLYGVLDAYLAALATNDPSAAPFADEVFNTENNVAIRVGDGLWNTLTEMGDYDLRFADTLTGQVAFFGSLFEGTQLEHPITVRLKVEDGLISEVETLVHRPDDTPSPFPSPIFPEKPAMNETLAPEDRSPRLRMVSIADGYFDTLQLNDGTLFTTFAPECTRFENGFETTNNPNQQVTAYMALGCEEQFRLGIYRYDDRVRGRRTTVVDEERGLIMVSGFIDHSGKLKSVTLTDGTEIPSPFLRPHTLHFMETFKIKAGAIEQVEANFIFVPYAMPSPWMAEELPALP